MGVNLSSNNGSLSPSIVVLVSLLRIKQVRGRLGMTSQELATALGVSISTVSRWETGRNRPSKLARARLMELVARLD